MRTRKMRLMSFVLALAMMLAIAPVSALAADEDDHTVIVTTTGGLQAAVEAKYGADNLDSITELVVKTADGAVLNKADFEFVSGVHVEGDVTSASSATYPTTDSAYLKSLLKLDLTDAKCEDDTIPARAFCKNPIINSIVLPNTLKVIGMGAFSSGYNRDAEDEIPNSIEYVGTSKSGTRGDDLTFPDTLTTIGFSAFYNSPNITGKVVFPNHSINLGSAAFAYTNVSSNEEIELNGNITLLGSARGEPHANTFYRTQITKVNVTGSEIAQGMFSSCPLTEISIADGVQKIGINAFRGIKVNNQFQRENTLTKPIVIPKSVTSIGSSAFAGVGVVDSIIVQNPSVTLDKWCFNELPNTKIYLASLPDSSSSPWDSTTVHLNMDGGTIDTTKLADSDKDSTTELYTPVKEGYTFEGWYNGNTKLTSTPTTNKTYTAHWKQDDNSAVLSTDMENKAYTVGDTTEFSFTTIASGSNVGKTVRAVTNFNQAKDSIQENGLLYLEKTQDNPEGEWKTFDGTGFGPANGFPLTDNATSNFKVTFKKAGTYNFNVAMKQVDENSTVTDTTVCEKNVTIRVNPRVQKITLPENVTVTVDDKDVSNEIQGKYLNISIDDLDKGATVAVTVKNPKYGDTYEWSGVEGAEVSEDGKTYTFKVVDSNAAVELETTSTPYDVGDFEVTGLGEYTYGDAVKVTVTPKDPDLSDYEVKYYDADGNEVTEMKEVGTYTVKVKIITGEQTIEAGKVVIKPADSKKDDETEKTTVLTLTACTAKLSDGTEVKNGDKVPVGTEVTVTFDKGFYADSNLVLSGWQVTPDTLTDVNSKLVKDITADSFTFVMPEAENGVTIEALTKTADTEDDSWDAATVVTGVVIGAGAAVLTYHIGTELYAKQVLGDGVAIPHTREDVALKAWELAGKPAVAVDGEPLSETAQAEKWAVESGLMQNNAEGNFNGAKKMNKLKVLRVLDSAKKMNAQ